MKRGSRGVTMLIVILIAGICLNIHVVLTVLATKLPQTYYYVTDLSPNPLYQLKPTKTPTPTPAPTPTKTPTPTPAPTPTKTPTPTPPPSEGNGGGGGAPTRWLGVVGVEIGEPFENVADKEVQYIWTLNPERDVTVQFKKSTHSISEIKFVYSQNVNEISVTIEKLINSCSPPGVIYENDNIWVNVPNPAHVSNATIRFRVEKGWISSNNIDPENIALFRFKEGVWNRLPTDRLFENETMMIYIATTPGFSRFAIAGEKNVSPPIQPTPTIAPTMQPTRTPISGPASTSPEGELPSVPFVIPLLLAIAISMIYLLTRIGGRKKE